MADIKLTDFAYVVRMPTRWADLDMLGHVNNTKFFTYDETARLSYFDEWMQRSPRFWKEDGMILAHIECDFLAQLHHPAELAIGFRVAKIGRSSLNTLGGIFNGETLVATTRGVAVWYDYTRQKPQPVPEAVREWIRQREVIKPDE
ncbi:MAG TPA: thioesterase family protein [Stenotrophobium sp.]|jgi:acyl-CoA thioester hydrolase|nr:thioesterase family protein [Stenotrophobium sp.]